MGYDMKKLKRVCWDVADTVLAQAYKRDRAITYLMTNIKPLTQHLVKLALFSGAQETNHWRKEVHNFLNEAPRLKSNNKYASKEFILEHTWEVESDAIDVKINKALKDYPNYSYNKFLPDIYNAVEQYFDWLAEELSTNGSVGRAEVLDKLEELGM